jgi:hypothetical protein
VVVSEALQHYAYGSHDAARRLRVLDLHYTYFDGGDVADVACTVRTLRRMSVVLPGNSLLWSRLGGMALSPDGRVLIAGSADPFMLNFQWKSNHYNTGGDSFVVRSRVKLSMKSTRECLVTFTHPFTQGGARATNGSAPAGCRSQRGIPTRRVGTIGARHCRLRHERCVVWSRLEHCRHCHGAALACGMSFAV